MSIADLISHRAETESWLSGIRAYLSSFLRFAFNPYHPEAHYMRGPGPACAAKQLATRPDRTDVNRIDQVAPMRAIDR